MFLVFKSGIFAEISLDLPITAPLYIFLYAVRNKLPIGYFCLLIYFLSLYRGPESGAGGGSGSVGQHYSGNKPPLISGGTVNDNSGGKGPIFLQN